LTFDDGPVPEVTPWVLSVLADFKARATFFVVGENVKKHPEVFRRIVEQGHSIGNHTYNHLKGWKTGDKGYLENCRKCAEVLNQEGGLFRPPYGRMRKSQIKEVLKMYEKIVMWDVLSYDFDKLLSPEVCLKKVLRKSREGSIVVFHDSIKAKDNLEFVLPRFLEAFSNKEFVFEPLSV